MKASVRPVDKNRRHRMSLCFIWMFFTFTYVSSAPGARSIAKCCPMGEILNVHFECFYVENTDSNTNDTNLDWFPVELIVNRSTLKIHEHHQDKYRNMLRDMFTVQYKLPECDKDVLFSHAAYGNGRKDFHYLLNEDFSMDFHVSKTGTGRAEDEVADFDVISDDAEIEEEVRTNGTLRTFPLSLNACTDLIETGSGIYHVLGFCPCDSMTCVRKCCKRNHFLNDTSGKCEMKHGEYQQLMDWKPNMSVSGDHYFNLQSTFPSCENPTLLKSSRFGICTYKKSEADFTILSNGSVQVYDDVFESDEYCGENTWSAEEDEMTVNLLICSRHESSDPVKNIIYGAVLLIGAVCLLLTVAVSLYLPEMRRRLHNKIALSHNISLMVAYFCWGTQQLISGHAPVLCLVLTLLVQFSFLGSFFWLNVMCLDISMTFRMTKSPVASAGSRRFLYYNIYSWGCTFLISIITLVMEFSPSVTNDNFRPGFSCVCGFNEKTTALLIYFYGPMIVILGVNLVMFVFTAYKILSVQRQTSSALRNHNSVTTGGSTFQAEKQRLLLYSKLFLLMGLTWMTEIISWAVGGDDSYWYLTDVINLLRGVFIFILFVCKKKVLRSLKGKLKNQFKFGDSRSTNDTGSTPYSDSTKQQQSNIQKVSKKEGGLGPLPLQESRL